MHHKTKDMEEKRYPHIDEEEGIGMCCEPMAEAVADTSVQTTKLPDGNTLVHDWTAQFL